SAAAYTTPRSRRGRSTRAQRPPALSCCELLHFLERRRCRGNLISGLLIEDNTRQNSSGGRIPIALSRMVGARSRRRLYLGRQGGELALMLSFRRAQELVATASWCRCLALPPTANRGARASGARRNEFPSPFSL